MASLRLGPAIGAGLDAAIKRWANMVLPARGGVRVAHVRLFRQRGLPEFRHAGPGEVVR